MLKHQLQISIKGSETRKVLECRRLNLKDRALRSLLGKGHRVLVLLPGDSVQGVTIKELGEGGSE